ncbi:ABC transporter permease [Actinomadura sp. LOL_016]|uniref:ABC transporter permease n=1 Tax=unclassified Actinomadura TaxID=2626254 RepID=UPI003A7FCDF4
MLGRDAGAGARVGGTVRLQVDGEPRPFRVVGLAPSGAGSVYFAPATAAALYGNPGKADALAVLGDGERGGALDDDALRAAVPGLDAATGDARGDAEDPSVAAARPDLLELGLSVGGVAIMTALVVVGGLIVLSVRDRTRELALLRAVGATPGQVRADLLRETARAGVPAALIGGLLALALGAGILTAMVNEGVLPEGFGVSLSPLPTLAAFAVTMLAAAVTAFLASLRATRIHPVKALGVADAEPARLPRRRLVAGLVFLFIGVNALGFAFTATGPTAAASVGGLVLALIVATAFLGPLLARAGARYLGGAAARRRELVLLRLVGATRRQVLRALRLEAVIVLGTGVLTGTLIAAVTLLAFALAVIGLPLPAVSPVAAAAILLGVAGSGAAAVMLPARAMLRRRATPTFY